MCFEFSIEKQLPFVSALELTVRLSPVVKAVAICVSALELTVLSPKTQPCG